MKKTAEEKLIETLRRAIRRYVDARLVEVRKTSEGWRKRAVKGFKSQDRETARLSKALREARQS
jgi:hypothetical protein